MEEAIKNKMKQDFEEALAKAKKEREEQETAIKQMLMAKVKKQYQEAKDA